MWLPYRGIEDPMMKKVRYLDKLVDELAKGSPMEKILKKQLQEQSEDVLIKYKPRKNNF